MSNERDLNPLVVAFNQSGKKIIIACDEVDVWGIEAQENPIVVKLIDTSVLAAAMRSFMESHSYCVLERDNINDIIEEIIKDFNETIIRPKIIVSGENNDVIIFHDKLYFYPIDGKEENNSFGPISFKLNVEFWVKLSPYYTQPIIKKDKKNNLEIHTVNNVALNYYRRGLLAAQIAVIEDLTAFCEESTGFPHAMRNIAEYFEGGDEIGPNRWRSSQRLLEMALEYEPDFPEAMLSLARTFIEQKEYKKAEPILIKASELPARIPIQDRDHPIRVKVLYEYGRLLEDFLNRSEEALEIYSKALENNLIFPDANMRLGRLLRRFGRRIEAVPYLEKALIYNPYYETTASLKLKNPF